MKLFLLCGENTFMCSLRHHFKLRNKKNQTNKLTKKKKKHFSAYKYFHKFNIQLARLDFDYF